jgi:hypothetical protein
VIPTSTPSASTTDRCEEAEKEEEGNAMERPSNKDEIKKLSKTHKMVRTPV